MRDAGEIDAVLDVASQAHELSDVRAEAVSVLRALKAEVTKRWPAALADLGAELTERDSVSVRFAHHDDSVLEVCHGDGYTAIVGGPIDFHGWLAPNELIPMILAGLHGGLTYVRVTRLGYKVADYFEIDGRGEPIGFGSYGIAGGPGRLLGVLPLPRQVVGKVGVGFDRGPAWRPYV